VAVEDVRGAARRTEELGGSGGGRGAYPVQREMLKSNEQIYKKIPGGGHGSGGVTKKCNVRNVTGNGMMYKTAAFLSAEN